MTSAEEFNCILCKETFDNKDELQIHFRKHGDPKFNESIKTKSRVQSEAPFANEKSNDASEMVNCDVCDEVFPTISKAITHKHKVHPEHDAKYFCPWCGKLFTMKHLYNKHLYANHDATEVPGSKDSHFHCDSCIVYFVAPSAMVYHNKFFHRQDSDLPIIGHSKKQKMLNQELLPVYYCSFCGEEYINKVNLHKHMCDDHEDENQRPTDVLRCPLCEAVFYHLDAYELHLTFHSSEDLYSETNEMNENEITEFSLETVPPLMERIEDLNSLPDHETDMNAVGIESFLQMAMDEPKDSNQLPQKRSKKHKKHKKSKKSAITLDEFLSMNQDVFGEDLDFQGIEEVPTKVIKKQLKVKKPQIPKSGAKHVSSADLRKLQKLGIAVKVPSGNKASYSKVKPIGQAIKVNPQVKNLGNQPKINAISASNDVLSKLLNQSSSQLKIVKKSTQEKAPDTETDQKIKTKNQQPVDTTEAPESIETNRHEKEEKGDEAKSYNTPLGIPKTNTTINQQINDKNSIDDRNDETVHKDSANANLNESGNECIRHVKLSNVSNNDLADMNMNNAIKNIGKQITIKQITQSATFDEDKRSNTFTPEVDETDKQNSPCNVPQKTNTLDTLKSLSRAITIKTLKHISVSETNKNSKIGNEKTDAMYKKEALHAEDNYVKNSENINKDLSVHKTSPGLVLQSISKNITIKSMSPLDHPEDDVHSDECDDNDFDNPEDDTLAEHKCNSVGEKVKEQSMPITAPHVLKGISKNILIKPISTVLKHPKANVPSDKLDENYFGNPQDDTIIENQHNNKNDYVIEPSVPTTSSSHVLKNISKHITIKPMSPILKPPKDVPKDGQYNSELDNLEDDTSMENKNKGVKSKEQTGHMTSTYQVLKNISKNITMKSMSPLIKHPKDIPDDEYTDSDFENPEYDGSIENKNKNEKNTEQSDLASSSSHVLKNISKNLTIKPMSPVMKQTKEDIPRDENNYSEYANFEDDTPVKNQNDHGSSLDRLKNKSNLKIKTVQTPLITKKTFGNINKNITGDEIHKKTNIQSSNNILKNLKNITAKPVLTNKSISQQGIVKSSNMADAKKQGNVKQSLHTKELNQDIEIYNIDDSDDEYEQQKTNKIEPTQNKKEPIKANVNSPAVLNAIKNMSKHITFKASNTLATLKEVVKQEETFLEQFSDEYEMPDDGEFSSNDDFEQMLDTSHKPTFIKNNTTNKNDNINNVLKQLGQHVTVKSKNAFNQPKITTFHPVKDFNRDTDSDEEPYTGRVKITEVTENDDNVDHENDCNDEGIVTQSPEDSNSGDEQCTKGIDDMNEYSSQNMKVRLNENLQPNSQGLLKNISNNITMKSISDKTANSSENESIANQSSLCKPFTQNRPDITNNRERASTSNLHSNKRNAGPGTSSPTVQQKFTKSDAVNTVNKEVKVKTFQSETVIEEITTTVTKTIRRVNQTTVNNQVFNASKVSPAPRMVKPQLGPRMPNIYSSNNLKGLTVRQPNPRTVRPNIRQPVPGRPSSTVVRLSVSNQLVPMRPSVTPIRPMNAPRMPVKNMPRQPRPVGRPLTISPNVVSQTLKRPGNEDPPGHFSCFKKPKESLIPGNETAEASSNFHCASSSQMSKFCSTSQTVRGNSVVTSTQMKAQSVTQQQQINRLGNISGLNVAKTCKVSQMETTEISPSKRTALETIEKLQKQGLLIKKPRVEEDPDPPNSDGEEHDQYDD